MSFTTFSFLVLGIACLALGQLLPAALWIGCSFAWLVKVDK